MASFVIGCDGGGTGCRIAIADARGRVLAQATGGPANVTSDFNFAIASVRAALSQAAANMGLCLPDLMGGVAHFGLAGVQSAKDAARVAAEFPFAKITVTEDHVIAVEGALGSADGVLLALGTGTIIAGRRGGRSLRIGGWGLQLSDDASGAWLGRSLLQRVLLAHDGMEPFSPLTEACFARFHHDPRGLVAFAATARPADYAGFAPDVVAAAQAGDAVGGALMQHGADYLARALAVMGFAAPDVLCLSGGVGPHYAPFLPKHVQRAIVAPKGQGVDGAVRLAQGHARALARGLA
ncbi:BadF/BadG/BcrA/BcrD ATPase family protein [Pseudorhodobacter sp. W20_MBD10_FR17]|uniref:BadF/BadG/BcrA/BcrD ATPase family protein n=1 Tax=Pseudorhodobacter sp. W20_MBD10_FR17 TaxID=3240266 RepID=UPI003F9DAB67